MVGGGVIREGVCALSSLKTATPQSYTDESRYRSGERVPKRLFSYLIGLAGLAGGLPSGIAAQRDADEEYLRFVPLAYPRLTRQTDASISFRLFGDPNAPGYRDVAPADGIDDNRHATLDAISRRFAPFLVQNTYSAPMDFTRLMQRQPVFTLYVDTWDLAAGRQLVDRETVDFNSLGQARCSGDVTGSQPRNESSADCKVVALMDRFDPENPIAATERATAVGTDADQVTVLFFDMPGNDPASWKEVYLNPVTNQLRSEFHDALKIYAHPFIAAVPAAGPGRYEFIIQYWFYYPLNDGGNNHEGDWEHINVRISPRSRVTESLTEPDLRGILAGRGLTNDASDDQLVIKSVEFFFHHRVMTVDYSAPNVYQSQEAWEAEIRSTPRERVGVEKLWAEIRRLAYRSADEGIVNTHPVAFIGADNKGLDQLLSPPGGNNQDSHGTFPFPGLYKTVGPAGSAEQIAQRFDHWAWYTDPAAARAAGQTDFGPGHVTLFDDASMLEVVPDWERVLPLVRTNPTARRDWAWLVLPVRWGYPATESPFAGLIDYADMGNLGPIGPAYNAGWNRPGTGRGFDVYEPNLLPSFFPVEPQDGFSNNLGFFNVVPLISNLPPFDFVWRVVALPFRAIFKRQDPIYYPDRSVPLRFVGITGGASYTSVPENMWFTAAHLTESNAVDAGDGATLPQPIIEIAEDIVARDSTGGENIDIKAVANSAWGVQAQAAFYVGKRFMSATGFRHSRHTVGFDQPFATGGTYEFRGTINWWDITGNIRYDLLTGGFKPYLNGGYGVNWYRLENMTSDGEPLDGPTGPWINNFWPPTWQYGFGGEMMLVQSFAPVPRGIDIGIRAEYLWLNGPTGLDLPGALSLATFRAVPTRWVRGSANFLLTVSF